VEKVSSVDAYINGSPQEAQATLRTLRKMMQDAVPGAEETISYGIPTYKLRGKTVVFFAGYKQHVSIHPASDAMERALPEIAAYRTGKGTLRFPLDAPLPIELICRVVGFLKEQHAERVNKKPVR
jgi:uncharacterized protein YdhG (YjbR/CyaY superfamily)